MTPSTSAGAFAPGAHPPPAILLVDNEVRNLEVLESILGRTSYALVRAETAQEALLALIEGEFAAIVLDIHMPGTGGLELAHLIKQRKRTAQIPIIFLTAYRQEDKDVLQGYEVGAADFLTKPIDPQILRSKIAIFVELFQKTRELASLNRAMEDEIVQRQNAERALQEANQALEARVQERVAALAELMRQKESQSRLFDTTLASITDLAYTFDLDGNWIYANKPLLEIWGKSLDEITGKSSLELGYPAELAERLRLQVLEVVATRKPVKGETYFTSASGAEEFHEYIFSPVLATDGAVVAVCGTTRLTTQRKRAEAAAESQRRVLQLIAEDAPLPQILNTLVRTVELESPQKAIASILLVDPEGNRLRHGAAPGLPDAFNQALDGMTIGPARGPCCAAIQSKLPVISNDLATDPNSAQIRDLARAHGLRACWSFPVLSGQGTVLGAVALYLAEPRQPTDADLKALEMAVRSASIALERKQRDEVLRDSERRYSQLVSGLPAAVYTTDAHGRITLFNEAALQLWGRRPEVGQDRWCGSQRILRPDGTPLPHEQSPMAITLLEGRPVRGEEIVIERPDGSRRNVLPYPDTIRDASGRLVGSVSMLLDITESKQAEEASRRLAAIVESTDDAIIGSDLNGIITSWNRAASQLLGYQPDEVLGKHLALLLPPDRSHEVHEIMARIRRGERLERMETRRRCKDGQSLDIWLTVSPIKDAAGRVVGASKIGRDITQKKQAERELERAHQELLAASRAKDDFLAALSHELRTPLNPVLLIASQAAEDPDLPPLLRDQFAKIRNGVELEARLIDDLLDITRITRGLLSLNIGLVDVHTLLHEAALTVQSEIHQKRIRLTMDLTTEPALVKGDAVRLQQVFWNVLKNAAKFTPEAGRIEIRTRIQPEPAQVIISVKDSGIGITPPELARIFEAFTQGEHARSGKSHRFGGLGLGLAIGRMLVDLHSGSIRASSEGRDRGATFTITLPLAAEKDAVPTLPAGQTPSGNKGGWEGRAATIRILLVEDHAPTRDALKQLLSRRCKLVTTAASVAEARSCAETQAFDMLISDIGLPDGTGFELMRDLRQANPDLQGIALTGYGLEEDIARSQANGFACHLIKPVRAQSLEAALAAALS